MAPPRSTSTGRPASSSDPAGGCPIGELMRFLSQPHMLGILHLVDSGARPLRFGEIRSALHLSPRTATSRLHALVEAGFLTRREYRERPPRVEYEATGKTRDLAPAFRSLTDWSGHHSLTAVPTVSVVGPVGWKRATGRGGRYERSPSGPRASASPKRSSAPLA